MNGLKEKKFINLINDIQHKINSPFNSYSQHVFRFQKENLYLDFGTFNELIQNKLQEASHVLEWIHHKLSLFTRNVFFFPGVVSWTVKYYELEEKIINLIKNLVHVLKDLYLLLKSQVNLSNSCRKKSRNTLASLPIEMEKGKRRLQSFLTELRK